MMLRSLQLVSDGLKAISCKQFFFKEKIHKCYKHTKQIILESSCPDTLTGLLHLVGSLRMITTLLPVSRKQQVFL